MDTFKTFYGSCQWTSASFVARRISKRLSILCQERSQGNEDSKMTNRKKRKIVMLQNFRGECPEQQTKSSRCWGGVN